MKKLLSILLCLPMLGVCQKIQKNHTQEIKKDYNISEKSKGFDFNKSNRYGSSFKTNKGEYNTSINNGTSPYNSYFGAGLYDDNSYNEVTFSNSNSSDVIVCLENIYSGATIRNEYIRKGSSYTMTKVPNGTYVVKVFYGNNWNPNKLLAGGKIKGGFDEDISFSISDDPSDYLTMNQHKTSEGTSYSVWSVTLYSVINGNMDQRPINVDTFFE